MTEIRTSTQYVSEIGNRAMKTAQSDIANLSKQAASGKFSDSYRELAENSSVEFVLNTKSVKSGLDTQVKNNQMLQSKMLEMERVVRALNEEVVRNSLKLCMDANNPGISSNLPIASMAQEQMESIRGYLNAQYNGEKLFAGSKTAVTDVVGDIANNTNIIGSTITANYYNGDSEIRAEKISSTNTLSYGITADHPTMQKLIAAHNYILLGNTSVASDMLQEVKSELGNMVTMLGEQSKTVSNEISIANKAVTNLTESISNAEDVDMTDLMPKFNAILAQLKGTYLLTHQISMLSIVDYLR